MTWPVVVGLVLGILYAAGSGIRVATGRNSKVRRNRDGSVFGGVILVALGVGVLWFVIGFVVTWLVMLPF